jgi:hypothetical protein
MQKNIVVLDREDYDHLSDLEKNQEKILFYNFSDLYSENKYIGKDEVIKQLIDFINEINKKLIEKNKYQYKKNLKSRLQFLFTGKIEIKQGGS